MVRFSKLLGIVLGLSLALVPATWSEAPPTAGPRAAQPGGTAQSVRPTTDTADPSKLSRPRTPLEETSENPSAAPPPAEPAKDNDKFRERYTQILDDIFKGIYEGDYTKFGRNLTEQMRAAQTRQSFLELQTKVQTNLGKLSSLEYLGFYSQGPYTMVLFKATFKKDKDDVLITLVSERQAADPKVGGLWLDSPALEK